MLRRAVAPQDRSAHREQKGNDHDLCAAHPLLAPRAVIPGKGHDKRNAQDQQQREDTQPDVRPPEGTAEHLSAVQQRVGDCHVRDRPLNDLVVPEAVPEGLE